MPETRNILPKIAQNLPDNGEESRMQPQDGYASPAASKSGACLAAEPVNDNDGNQQAETDDLLDSSRWVSQEEIMTAMEQLKEKLGRYPSCVEVSRELKLGGRRIRKLYGRCLEKIGNGQAPMRKPGVELTMQELFVDWVQVARKVKRMPRLFEYEMFSAFSVRPLKSRFQRWDRIPAGMLEFGEAEGLWTGWQDVKDMASAHVEKLGAGRRTCTHAKLYTSSSAGVDVERILGEPFAGLPMANAPVNEQGVVYLFGAMARELGFVVLSLQAGYPDCLALRRMEDGMWRLVRIELEFESRNFVAHEHDPKGCDLIVCWEHNWTGCPLEVVELKKYIGRSGDRVILDRRHRATPPTSGDQREKHSAFSIQPRT